MSSSAAAVRAPVGAIQPESGSRREPRAFTAEELAFARRVRSPWWDSCAPLLETLLFGVVLVVAAALSGQTPTVQRMLDANENRAIAEARAAERQRDGDYQLPPQWQPWGLLEGQPSRSAPAVPADRSDPGAALDCAASNAGAPC